MTLPDRAWTIGWTEVYEKSVRIPGNGKAVSGVAFRTRDEALDYIRTSNYTKGRSSGYSAYEMVMPAPYDECVSRDGERVYLRFHEWHTGEGAAESEHCPVCSMTPPRDGWDLDHDALLVTTRFINPDTGDVV